MRLDGVSLKETAVQCELSRTTVIAAVKAFQEGGRQAVRVHRPGRPAGSGRALTAEQQRQVQRLIRDRTPDQLKLAYALWTRQVVAELTRDRFGIELAVVRTLGLYLKRWEFTLWLVTAARSGAYLSDAEAQILDRSGDTVLQTRLKGPYLMADLPPGVYTVRVSYGDQVREARIGIQSGATREYLMRFDSPAELSPDLRRG